MAFEDCYAVTLNVCSDCMHHIEYGEGSCCHEDRPDDRPCPTGVRLERQHRNAVAFTAGCTDDDCSGCDERGWRAADCEGCGTGHGDQDHYTKWVRHDARPERTITRNGWRVVIRPNSYGHGLWTVATRGEDERYQFDGPYSGADRWRRVADFVATLAA